MFRPPRPTASSHDASQCRSGATAHAQRGRTPWRHRQPRAATPSRWESSPTRRARSRSSGSRTPTWPGWSSATSTPRAACSGATSSCTSRTARRTTRSRPTAAAKLVEQDSVDVVFGGIYSSTRQAIKGPVVVGGQDALHLPRAVRGAGVRPAHLLHRPGARAAGRPVHPVADAGDRGEDVLPAVRRLHLAARDERARPRGRHGQRRGDRRRGVLPARPRGLPRRRSSGSRASGADVVFNTTVPPGVAPFLEQLHDSGFTSRGGQLVCTYFDENLLSVVPAAHVEGLYSCLDYYQTVGDPFSRKLLAQYDALYPGDAQVHRRQRVLGPVPRAAPVGGRRRRRRARSTRTT